MDNITYCSKYTQKIDISINTLVKTVFLAYGGRHE